MFGKPQRPVDDVLEPPTAMVTRQALRSVEERLERLTARWDVVSGDLPAHVREDFDDLCRLFCALHSRRGHEHDVSPSGRSPLRL